MKTRWDLKRIWMAEIDGLPLRLFEILFTLTFLWRFISKLFFWEEWLTEAGFHLTSGEQWSMGYPLPYPLLSPWMVPVLALITLGGGLMVIFFRWRRLGLILCFLTATYTGGVDYLSASSQERIYVVIYALLATGPGLRRAAAGGYIVASAMPRVLQVTLVLIYFVAGYSKCYPGDWLKYSDVVYTHVQGFHRTDLAAWMIRTLPVWCWTVIQGATILFEVFAPVWFYWKRTRLLAIVYGFQMHLGIALLMKGLIFFSAQMLTLYSLFLTGDEWRRIGAWILGWSRPPTATSEISDREGGTPR
jgi:hypothetical protein